MNENKNVKSGKRRSNYRGRNRKDRGNNKDLPKVIEGAANVDNDPNWYYLDAALAEMASKFAFNQFTGVDFTAGEEYRVPALCQVYYSASPGFTGPTGDPKAGINATALRTYLMLSNNNAKTTQYQPNDITICMLAIGSMIEMYSYLKRMFGLAFQYSLRNRAVPRMLLQFAGLQDSASVDDFLAHIADYRLRFNTLITQANRIAFPVNLAWFDKCSKMYSDVYLDSPNSMAQMYVPLPYSVWTLKEDYDDNGSGLLTTNPWRDGRGFDTQLDVFEGMISALMSSSTLNYIYADVLNVASKSNIPLVALSLLQEGYLVEPLYSETFLMQLENATIVGAPADTDATVGNTAHNDVKSSVDHGSVIYNPMFKTSGKAISYNRLLNFSHDNPTVAERVDSTRYSVIAKLASNPQVATHFYTTDILLPDHFINVIEFQTHDVYQDQEAIYSCDPYNAVNGLSMLRTALNMAKFAHMPRLYFHTEDNSENMVSGDFEYFTDVDWNYLKMVHDMSFYGLFTLR